MNMTQSGELPLAIGITFTISGKQSDEKVQLPASENFVDQQEFLIPTKKTLFGMTVITAMIPL